MSDGQVKKENSVELIWVLEPQYMQSGEMVKTSLIYTHIGNRTTIAISESFDI